MKLVLGMPVKFGPLKGMIYGGPFKEYVPGTRRLVGVKMAAEINHPHDISIPTEDFSIPDECDMKVGINLALKALVEGNDIYAGCMGGIGRTGLFMGCMAKLMADWHLMTGEHWLDPDLFDPVKYVRHYYKAHAIETQEQQAFVRGFDTAPGLAYLNTTLPFEPLPMEKEEKVAEPTMLDWFFNPVKAWAQLWKP